MKFKNNICWWFISTFGFKALFGLFILQKKAQPEFSNKIFQYCLNNIGMKSINIKIIVEKRKTSVAAVACWLKHMASNHQLLSSILVNVITGDRKSIQL